MTTAPHTADAMSTTTRRHHLYVRDHGDGTADLLRSVPDRERGGYTKAVWKSGTVAEMEAAADEAHARLRDTTAQAVNPFTGRPA
jgi:hypothetical protein